MADILDEVAEAVKRALTIGPRAIPSAAPGGGPEADRENRRTLGGGRIGSHIPRGGDATGYGGHGDPAALADPDTQAVVGGLIDQHVLAVQRKGLREPRPSGRIRFNHPFSMEAHIENDWRHVSGPFSLFDGTITAPGAGNSTVEVAITMPTSAPSPILLLNRYPGAMYVNLYVRSFAYMPTATTMTGLQEIWFQDDGGSVVGLGVYNASSQTANYVSIGALCTSPFTDPGNVKLGKLVITNIGIGGTPVTARYQLSLGYMAMVPDPSFNEQVIIPPTPAEIAQAMRTMEAGGN